MAVINFDSGVKEYSLNGKFSVWFNPTDSNFAEMLYNTFDELDKKQEEFRTENIEDGREAFKKNRERDREMRAALDDILGEGACASLFGGMNVYALADGLPVWANLMLAIIDEMDDAVKAELKKTNPRVAKYTARYKR